MVATFILKSGKSAQNITFGYVTKKNFTIMIRQAKKTREQNTRLKRYKALYLVKNMQNLFYN